MLAAAGQVVGVVVVLLLAADELDVPAGETIGVADGHGPIRGPEEEQILERDVLAVVDDVALDAIPMRIVDQSLRRSCAPIPRVGLNIVPQPRIALRVDGSPAHDAGILDVVEDEQRSLHPSSARPCRGRQDVVRILGGPLDRGSGLDVKLHVALHHHQPRQIDAAFREKEHAAAGPGGHVANSLVDLRGLDGLAGIVDLVVHDVDHIRIAQFRSVGLGRVGEKHQAGA